MGRQEAEGGLALGRRRRPPPMVARPRPRLAGTAALRCSRARPPRRLRSRDPCGDAATATLDAAGGRPAVRRPLLQTGRRATHWHLGK